MAQDVQNYISGASNSTTTTLDTNATFTGTWEFVSNLYSAVTVQAYASHASATNGCSLQFSNEKTNVDLQRNFTVTATDVTNTFRVPVEMRWFRVVYTNSTDSLTTFRLTTMFHSNSVPATNAEGEAKVILGDNSGVDIGDVTINNASGASAVNIQDGGNSITIDGTVSTTAQTIVDSLYGVVTLTADSTAYQLSALIADTLDVYSVTFTNYTSGAVVHFGTDNSLTIDNGAQPSYYTWDCTRYGDSTTDFWLASTANTTKVRYTIKVRR